jgi:cytochrome c peroxidase
LFFDARLSADGRVSCAGCHQPDQGWTVHAPVARGVHGQAGRRNPPGLRDAASLPHWGWDGAGVSLAAQVLRPLTDPREMGHAALNSRDAAQTGEALVAFLRTLHEPTRFDRFAQGEAQALSDQELQGLHLFRTRARCANCHFGPQLSDGLFHNLGIAFFGEPSQDLGRHAVSGRCEDVGRFRTASLRHVASTAPYMHHGLFETLAGVVHLYARGGGDPRNSRAGVQASPLYECAQQVSPHLQPLDLSEDDIKALLAFLQTL